jgi:hypothetical protein
VAAQLICQRHEVILLKSCTWVLWLRCRHLDAGMYWSQHNAHDLQPIAHFCSSAVLCAAAANTPVMLLLPLLPLLLRFPQAPIAPLTLSCSSEGLSSSCWCLVATTLTRIR